MLNSSCKGAPGMAITFGRGGKAPSSFHRNQLPAPTPGPRQAGDCGLWVCPGRAAEQVGPASPGCGHPAWGAPAGRLEAEVALPSLLAHMSGPGFWGSQGPGAFRGQGVWLPLLRGTAKGWVGPARQRSAGLASRLGQASPPLFCPGPPAPCRFQDLQRPQGVRACSKDASFSSAGWL